MTSVVVSDLSMFPSVAELIEHRKRLGLDRRDEVWEGVLHMSPAPHRDHGLLVMRLGTAFTLQADRYGLGSVIEGPNVREPGSGEKNYRVPDLAVATPEEMESAFVDGWAEGPLALAVEVRSPDEKPEAKLAFYAARRVREVLLVDRESRQIQALRLAGASYLLQAPDREGFIELNALDARLRRRDRDGRPAIEVIDQRDGGPLPLV